MQEETEFELDILSLRRENILFIWCLIIDILGMDMNEFQKLILLVFWQTKCFTFPLSIGIIEGFFLTGWTLQSYAHLD